MAFGDFLDAGNTFIGLTQPGHGGGQRAAEQQEAAAREALAQQQALFGQQQQANTASAGQAAGYAQAGTDQGAQYLRNYGDGAHMFLNQGQDRAISSMGSSQQSALASLGQGYGQARGDIGQVAGLQSYAGQAASGINPYDVTSARSRLSELADGGLARGFQADPGYQFRLQQGEQAINRAASAQGGRFGGRTLQALQQHGQDLASQEYDKHANRQMGLAGQIDQSNLAALMNQAGRSDQAALAQRGAQMQLAQTGLGAQSQLGQLAYGYGGQQAGMHQQYGNNLANLYQQTAQGNANINMQAGSQLGNMYSQLGQTQGGYTMDAAGMNSQLAGQMMGAIAASQYAGGGQAANANQQASTFQSGASMVGGLIGASDARLKRNIETVPSKYEAIGLRGVRWEWNDKAERIGLTGAAEGVLAQEVADVFPQALAVDSHGFLMVNYGELDRLVAAREAA
jgi:hypothetical protein